MIIRNAALADTEELIERDPEAVLVGQSPWKSADYTRQGEWSRWVKAVN